MEKEIDGFPGYSVTDDGRVFSFDGKRKGRAELVGYRHPGRYHDVLLRRDGKTMKRSVHRLVALAFLNPVGGHHHVNHKNGDKHDNRVENLEWTTPSKNMQHAVATGLWTEPTESHKENMRRRSGEAKSLFTIEEASDILEMKDTLGLSCAAVAKIVGCSKTPIQRLANGSMRYFKNGVV